ncbi:MAG: prepilin-type N-terminal cleavage/methylation domain-containing protein [Planctomycetota bacterium]
MCTHHPRARTEGGFSLLEVMVALAILALAAFPMLEVCNNSIDDASLTRLMRVAKDLANRKLNEVRLGDPAVTDGSSGEFSQLERRIGEYQGFFWEVSITTEGDAIGGEDSIADPADPTGGQNNLPTDVPNNQEEEAIPLVLKRVEVLVRYPYIRNEREYRLETYIYLPQDEEDIDSETLR